MLTDPTFLISMTQDESNYYIGLYIFLAIGALMLIVAFLGCCGAFKESQCLLVSVSSRSLNYHTGEKTCKSNILSPV